MQPDEFLKPYPREATAEETTAEEATADKVPPRAIVSEILPDLAETVAKSVKTAWEEGLELGKLVRAYLEQDPNTPAPLSASKDIAPFDTVAQRYDRAIPEIYREMRKSINPLLDDVAKTARSDLEEILRQDNELPDDFHRLPLGELGDTYSNSGEATRAVFARVREAVRITGEADSQLSYHQLNQCMLPMWRSLLDGLDPKESREEKLAWIERVQTEIALLGTQVLIRRQSIIDKYGQKVYFSGASPLTPMRETLAGSGAEYDVAIQLLEMIKQAMIKDESLNLTVIPAPPQFEQTDHYKTVVEPGSKALNPNADFLVINLNTHQVTGVQVKAGGGNNRQAKKAEEHYDLSRVTLLYGMDISPPIRVKIPNKNQRTARGELNAPERLFFWSGQLAIALAMKANTYGPESRRKAPWGQRQPDGYSRKDGRQNPANNHPEENQSRLGRNPRLAVQGLARGVLRHTVKHGTWPDASAKELLQKSQNNPDIPGMRERLEEILAEVGVPTQPAETELAQTQ